MNTAYRITYVLALGKPYNGTVITDKFKYIACEERGYDGECAAANVEVVITPGEQQKHCRLITITAVSRLVLLHAPAHQFGLNLSQQQLCQLDAAETPISNADVAPESLRVCSCFTASQLL